MLGLPLALNRWRRGVARLRVLLVRIAAATAAVAIVAVADALVAFVGDLAISGVRG